jgi:hypothetical protein
MGIHVIAKGAVVSCGLVPMRLRLVWCHSGIREGGDQKLTTFSESISRRNLLALGVVPGDGTEVWGNIHMSRGRVGEERGSKETDGCPLTLPPLQKCSVMTYEDRQEVSRSTLVEEIESKRAVLICHAVPGYLQ